jgi:hypothetical protein
MSKARDLANAGTALGAVSATELAFVDGVTSAIQTQIDTKAPSSTAVTLTGTQTLTNKTLTNPVIASVVNNTLTSTTGDMIYASAANTPARLAIGSTDQVLKVTGGIPAWSTPASGVITFTQLNSVPKLVATARCIETNGSNIIVVAGNSGELMSSTDSGATFTARTSGFSTDYINDIAFGAGIFVAVGAAGKITTSTDGITWTARTAGVASNSLEAVTYENSTFVAVGAGASGGTGGITTSTDGITWTKRTTPGTSATTLYSVAYGNGYWVAVGSISTNAGYYSTNLSTWTALSTTLSDDTRFVRYTDSNGWFVINSGRNGGFVTGTTPTGTWYSVSSMPSVLAPGTTGLESIIGAYNGKIYYASGATGETFIINSISDTFPTYTASTNVKTIHPKIMANNIITSLTIKGSKIFVGDSAARIYSATLT